jgi:hypothetical protein
MWQSKEPTPSRTLGLRPDRVIVCLIGLLLSLGNCGAATGGSNLEVRKLQDTLASLYQDQGEVVTMPLVDVKRILEYPPDIKNAVFVTYMGYGTPHGNSVKLVYNSTNWFWSAWGQNGYFSSFGMTESGATNNWYRGTIQGKFGNTNWRGSSSLPHMGGIAFSDGKTDSERFFGKDAEHISSARRPLNLGAFFLAIGTVRFTDDTRFVAANTLDGKTNVNGRLIMADRQTVSGMELEWQDPKTAGSIYIVSFLRRAGEADQTSQGAASGIEFPRRVAAYRIDHGKTNFITGTVVASMELSSNVLPAEYFLPSTFMKDKYRAESLIVRNTLLDKLGGKYIPAKTIVRRNALFNKLVGYGMPPLWLRWIKSASPGDDGSWLPVILLLVAVVSLFVIILRRRKRKPSESR